MGFFDFFKRKASTPIGGTDDFGRIDPNDQQAFWALNSAFGQATMGGPDAQSAFFAKHGVRDQAHWQQIQYTLNTKWANAPGGAQAMSAAMYANSAAQTAAAAHSAMAMIPGIPAEELAPIEGLDLQTYARVQAAREQAGGDPSALARAMARFALDETRFSLAQAGWQQRMTFGDPNRSVIVATLSAQYQMMLAQAKMPS